MQILVDTSIWIDYFKSGKNSNELDVLIDENLIVINEIILAEIVPFLKVKRQGKIIQMLNEVIQLPIDIDWDEIIQFQFRCLKSGINGVGIPDLLIAQNIKQNNCKIYTLDKHFQLMKDIYGLNLFLQN